MPDARPHAATPRPTRGEAPRLLWTWCLVLCVLLATACSREAADWEAAQTESTVEAYEAFLVSYPESEHRDSVLARIETLRLESARASHGFEEYEGFLSDFPDSTHRGEIESRLQALASERLAVSFAAVREAVKPGEHVLAPDVVDHSKYDEARGLLDELLGSLPESVVALNNQAVLAVEEGDLETARALFGGAVAAVGDDLVDEVALRIGIGSADETWLSYFYLLQPAESADEELSYAKRRNRPKKKLDPLTVVMDMSTPGAAQVRSLEASPCEHVVVDPDVPTYLFKTELENNVRALDALVDPAARRMCR